MTTRTRPAGRSSAGIPEALGSLALVGAGPGDPGLLTRRAEELLTRAELVVLDPALPADVLTSASPTAELVRLSGEQAVKTVAAAAGAGRRVVWLVTGDPFADAGLAEDCAGLAAEGLPVEVVAGVTTTLGVATTAGMPVQGAVTVQSLLTREAVLAVDWARLALAPGALVLTLPASSVQDAALALTRAGLPADVPVSITTAATTLAQHTATATLASAQDALAPPAGTTAAALARAASRATVRAAALAALSNLPPAATALPAAPGDELVTMVVGAVAAGSAALGFFESRPLFGQTVLIPRTKEQAGELASLLRGYGAVPLEVPTIAVEPPRTPAPMERAIKGLVTGRYAWIAFTSTNAVRAVWERLDEVGLDARAFDGVKIAAVGPATAEALRAIGVRADLVPSGEQSSDGLLADFPDREEGFEALDRVFLPRADIATETLAGGLKERGWAVDDVTAYRTVRAAPPPAPVREALKSGGVDAVVFTSSSTVRNLLGIAGKPHDSCVIACIGPQTEATAREQGLRVDVVAGEPSVASLAAGLAAFVTARRSSATATRPPSRRRR